jgi:hypothetical protein
MMQSPLAKWHVSFVHARTFWLHPTLRPSTFKVNKPHRMPRAERS